MTGMDWSHAGFPSAAQRTTQVRARAPPRRVKESEELQQVLDFWPSLVLIEAAADSATWFDLGTLLLVLPDRSPLPNLTL